MKRAVDLFCGAGGFSKGLENAGIEVVAAYDNWKPALMTYTANFSHTAYEQDLSYVTSTAEHIAKISPDIVFGGPPCQDFSGANRQGGDKHNASKTISYAQIVSSVMPNIVLMENVTNAKFSRSYNLCIDILCEAGYNIKTTILNASFYNVPQRRKRLILVGTLDNSAEVIVKTLENAASNNPLTVYEYMGDEVDFTDYFLISSSTKDKRVHSIYDTAPTVIGRKEPISPTLKDNHKNSAPLADVEPLSLYHMSRLQTFPKNWVWPKTLSMGNVAKLIGNAVPVNLAEAIGNAVMKSTEKQEHEQKNIRN